LITTADWQRIRHISGIKLAEKADRSGKAITYNATIAAVDPSEAGSGHSPEGESVGRFAPRRQTQYVDVC